jgi:hypothetical protein
MTQHRRPNEEQIPEFEEDRDVAHDDRRTHPSGTDTERDHSEREGGGDQEIDTAGQVPGEMATDPDDATGF